MKKSSEIRFPARESSSMILNTLQQQIMEENKDLNTKIKSMREMVALVRQDTELLTKTSEFRKTMFLLIHEDFHFGKILHLEQYTEQLKTAVNDLMTRINEDERDENNS